VRENEANPTNTRSFAKLRMTGGFRMTEKSLKRTNKAKNYKGEGLMEKGYYQFKVGDIECISIWDGTITVPDMVTPKPFNPRDLKSGIEMSTNCLLIMTGGHKILVDTGCGHWFGNDSGKLVESLKAAGISPEEIDMVVITHAHGDHIGGNTDKESKPIFNNARFIFHRLEWEYWMGKLRETDKKSKDDMLMTRKSLTPIRDRVAMVEDKVKVAPGLEVSLTPGHTPGHIMLYISSGTSRLCCLGDLIHHKEELARPEIYSIFDVDPQEATEIRKEVPLELADPKLLLWSCHLDFPGLGYFVKQGKTVAWQPI
jgi:glyoxylase-like metal-dependent hydrolase (beta-lactamase superfamily II)